MEFTNKTMSIIQTLFERMQTYPKDSLAAISLYIPTESNAKKDVRHMVKTLLEDILHENVTIKSTNAYEQSLINTVLNTIDAMPLEKGLAVFLEYNPSLSKSDDASSEFFVIVHSLPTAPIQEVTFGKEYFIGGLLKTIDAHFSAYVSLLTEDKYTVFSLIDGDLEPLQEIAASVGMEPQGGTGESHSANRKLSSENDSVIELCQCLKEHQDKNAVNYLVCFYTAGFSDEQVAKHFSDTFSDFETDKKRLILIGKSFTDNREIAPLVDTIIKELKEDELRVTIENIYEQQEICETNIEKILQSLDNKNAAHLFLKPDVNITCKDLKSQSITLPEELMLYEENEDILPWMLRKTWLSGGRISYVPQEMLPHSFLLKLRYPN